MIRISVRYGRDGSIEAFSVNGHAGYDEAGRDIVCAAVSAVVQTAVIGLTDVVGLSPEYHRQDGFLQCILPTGLSDKDRKAAGLVLHTMLAGLKSIQYGYSDFISIEEREVE
jgi:uncharacterized protein YsxB (DUF464 family)